MEKIALITGGSQGIGKALAEEFARNGYSLILIARPGDNLQVVKEELSNKYPCNIKIYSIDLQLEKNIENLIEHFKEDLPNVEVLVNNAGFTLPGKFNEIDIHKQHELLEVNIIALTLLTHRILPFMLKKKRGKILNVASIAAFTPGPFMATYYASKAYVLSFSNAIAREYKANGITVTALCPGPVQTSFWKGVTNILLLKVLPPMSPETVAAAGYKGLMHNKRIIVPGILNNISVLAMNLSPIRFKTFVTGYLNKE